MASEARAGVRLVEPTTVDALVDRFGGTVDAGVGGRTVDRLVRPEDARAPTDLVVLTTIGLAGVVERAPGVVLCATPCADRVDVGSRWVHGHAMWVVARLLAPLCEPDMAPEGGPAHVSPRASVASDVALGAGAVVRSGAKIGASSVIGENAVVFGRVVLGERVHVGPGTVIGRPGFGWTSDPEGHRVRVPHAGGVVIEDDVELGALCTVDAGVLSPTRIARGAKLDAHVHVGHNVSIGSETVVAAQTGFAGSVRVGARALFGGQSGVADHVVVGEGARVAAKSGVIGDVPAGATVAGFPAVSRGRWLRAMAFLLGRGRGRSR